MLKLSYLASAINTSTKNALSNMQFMTNIKLLRVSAPGAVLRQFFIAQENKPNTLI
jgi:hypothetical protein